MALKTFKYDQLDAAENEFFARQLEEFLPELYNIKYPALMAREMLPVSYAAGPGARLITYRAYTLTGIAQAIANYADDAPMADAFGQEFTSKVKDYGLGWAWTVQELQASARAGRSGIGPVLPLDTAKAMACRRGQEVNIDNVAFAGDATTGLIGFNNVPGANTVSLPNGAAGSALWANKTPDEMLADLFTMENTPLVNSSEVEFATRLLMPAAKYRVAKDTRVSIASDTTVLKYFLAESSYIKEVRPWWKLTGAGAAGADRMISYRPNLDTIRLEIPQEFNTLPPEPRNFAFVINSIVSVGGVICPYPISVTYGDGL